MDGAGEKKNLEFVFRKALMKLVVLDIVRLHKKSILQGVKKKKQIFHEFSVQFKFVFVVTF